MSLANAYRATEFDEIVGNYDVIEALRTSLNREKDRPTCSLFTGPSGTGKTTFARLVAEHLKGELIELNTADFRGIDTGRMIIDHARFQSVTHNCKVFFMDEAHQISHDCGEALLKLMEESPTGVVLIFATTDPQKLKTTFKRRCTTFALKALKDDSVREFLAEVCEAEEVKMDDSVLSRIASLAEGSIGVALNMLDVVVDLDSIDQQLSYLNTFVDDTAEVKTLCQALVKKKTWKEVSAILKGLNGDPESIRRAVLGYANAVLLNSGSKSAYFLCQAFKEPFYNTGKAGLTIACYEALNV